MKIRSIESLTSKTPILFPRGAAMKRKRPTIATATPARLIQFPTRPVSTRNGWDDLMPGLVDSVRTEVPIADMPYEELVLAASLGVELIRHASSSSTAHRR